MSLCHYFETGHCRSCASIQQDYSAQLRLKEEKLRRDLAAGASLSLEPTVGSSLLAFRNRAKMAVTGTVDHPVIGLHGEGHLDRGRELLSCPIHHPRINEVLAALPALLRLHRIAPYRIDERRGELKGLIAFYSPQSEEMYLRFVLRSQESVARLRKMLFELQSRFPFLVCVSANLQPIPHAILEGPEEIFLTQRTSIVHQLGNLRLSLAPQAFVQTNVEVATKLYETAAKWIAEVRPSRAMELFCGQGAFSLMAASSAESWLGIEVNPAAVREATEAALSLGASHVRFQCADATRVGPEIEAFSPELMLVNPPRRGLAGAVDLIAKALPRNAIYSSCNSESLALDLKSLGKHYGVRRAQIFDLFPHTEHFETLVWLERLN
jgi:23S rRNA (uracil747-C5)-methyltransferase